MKRILFLTQGPMEAPSSRVRVYQYLPFLKERGWEADVLPGLSSRWFKRFYTDTTLVGKLSYFGMIFFRRLFHLLKLKGYDVIFLQRPALPYLPPFFERVIRRRARRLIFDFDDAIYLSRAGEWLGPRAAGWLGRAHRKKVECLVACSDSCIVGNSHLASFARQYQKNVHVLPSVVDTARYAPHRGAENAVPVIVWIGTPSTAPYLKMIAGPLNALAKNLDFRVRVIGARYGLPEGLTAEVIPWDLETEVAHLQTADIGIMPLVDGERERGKCGYKLLQYMACGLPAVASGVGANREIIVEGQNGFFADNDDDWIKKLAMLLKDKDLRMRMGFEARRHVQSHYSLSSALPKFVGILDVVSSTGPAARQPRRPHGTVAGGGAPSASGGSPVDKPV